MILIITFVISILLIFYLKEFQNRRKAPPGPWPVPVFGNLPQFLMLAKDPREFVYKLSKEYGEICRFRMGLRDTIFLCSYESYCKLFSESVSRPIVEIFYERNLKENTGISFANGDQWSQSKTWTVKILRELGFFSRSHVEGQILTEIDLFLNKIETQLDSSGNGVLEMHQFFAVPVTKVMWRMTVGRWNPEDDVLLTKVVDSSYTFLSQGVVGPGIINAFPFLKRLFPEALGLNMIMELTKVCRKIARELLDESLRDVENIDKPNSIIEAFAINMNRNKTNNVNVENELNIFTTMNFETIFMDLLQGSADPANTFLERLVLFMALYPESQDRISAEIKETWKAGEKISFESFKLMTYTQAFLLEMHRYVPIMQQNVRQTDEDVYYKQYLIPKGSELTCDLLAIYKNLNVFGDYPEEFRPQRFLNEMGEVFNQKYISPFGIGKRSCPGQRVGELVTFLFFVSIVQRYKISFVPGDKRPQEFPFNSLITLVYPFRVHFSKRQTV